MAAITIPKLMRDWVRSRVESGAFADEGEYLRALIRRDQEDDASRSAIVAALEAGEASGISPRQIPEILAALKAERGGSGV